MFVRTLRPVYDRHQPTNTSTSLIIMQAAQALMHLVYKVHVPAKPPQVGVSRAVSAAHAVRRDYRLVVFAKVLHRTEVQGV